MGGPVFGLWGPQKCPNLKIDAIKTLPMASEIFWCIICYPNLKSVEEVVGHKAFYLAKLIQTMHEHFRGPMRSHTSDWLIWISEQSHWLAKRACNICQTCSFSSQSMVEMKTITYQDVESRVYTNIVTSSFVTRAAIGRFKNRVNFAYIYLQL